MAIDASRGPSAIAELLVSNVDIMCSQFYVLPHEMFLCTVCYHQMSVYPSVTSQCCAKSAKHRMMKTVAFGSRGTHFFLMLKLLSKFEWNHSCLLADVHVYTHSDVGSPMISQSASQNTAKTHL